MLTLHGHSEEYHRFPESSRSDQNKQNRGKVQDSPDGSCARASFEHLLYVEGVTQDTHGLTAEGRFVAGWPLATSQKGWEGLCVISNGGRSSLWLLSLGSQEPWLGDGQAQ